MRSLSAESESELVLTTVTNFLACAAVVALVAGVLFFLVDLHVALAGGASSVESLTPILFLIGVVAIQRVRARGEEVPYWPVYVVLLAFAMVVNVSRTTHNAPAGAKAALYGGIALLWIIADRLTKTSTTDATKTDTSEAGLIPEEAPRPGDRTRETKVLEHPGALVIMFSFVALAVFLLGERFVTGGSLSATAGHLKLALVGALLLLAITALFGHLRYALAHKVQRSGAFMPVWLVSAGVLIAGAVLLGTLIPRTDAALRNQVFALAEGVRRKLVRAPVTGDPTAEEPGKKAGEGPREAERARSEKPHPSGRQASEGARRAGAGATGRRGPRRSAEPVRTPGIAAALRRVIAPLRYLAWIALAIGVLYVLLRFGRSILRDAAKLGGLRAKIAAALERLLSRILGIPGALGRLFRRPETRAETIRQEPFQNPFLIREMLEDRSLDEAVRYAYEQMRKIADELPPHGRKDLTPYEFLRDLPASLARFRDAVRALTDLYVQAAYSTRRLDEREREKLARIWDRLIEFAESADLGPTAPSRAA